MKPEANKTNNQPSNNHIDEIVERLQRLVGIKQVAIMSEVPPGASLNALLQAYKEEGVKLKALYPPIYVDYALDRINEQLSSEVFG